MNNRLITSALLCGFLALLFLIVPARAEDGNNLPSFDMKWEYPITEGLPLSIAKDTQNRPYLYVADKDGGVRIIDISRAALPVAAATVEKRHLGSLDAMAVAQQDNYVYVALGDFFDVHGTKAGLGIIDVSKPQDPVVSAVWLSSQTLQGASSVLVSGNIVYVSAMQTGVLIFDVTDKKHPKLLSSLTPYVDFPHKNPPPLAQPKARGMALHDNLLLLADDAGGLRLIDVTDPAHPKEKAAYINADLMRKQQAYNAVAVDWPTAYVTTDYCGLEVVDLSDLKNIHQKGIWNPWRCDSLLNYWFNSPGHSNQITLDAEAHRLYLTAGDSELRVLDITAPETPKLVAAYGAPKDKKVAWGLLLTDDMIYLSYIKAQAPFGGNWSGIRALSR